jgi:hypothetical protein
VVLVHREQGGFRRFAAFVVLKCLIVRSER